MYSKSVYGQLESVIWYLTRRLQEQREGYYSPERSASKTQEQQLERELRLTKIQHNGEITSDKRRPAVDRQ